VTPDEDDNRPPFPFPDGEDSENEIGIEPINFDDPVLLGGDAPDASLIGGDDSSEGTVRPTFARGEIAADRYEIVRFIARGGMGEVYEARDLELGRTVAIKTIAPEIAADQKALQRFKNEILLAQRVTHPNVCRIYDLGRHRIPATERVGATPSWGPREVSFLTMELLSGDTLYDRVHRFGPLPEEDALPIVRQMGAALDAAHAAGVVHRDFKTANVMLCPPLPGSREGVRAVVTDFGLARSNLQGDSNASLSASGMVVGTPAYMAPEQVEGKPLGPACDIYALGLVIYEMMTGRLPFTGGSAISVAAKRLNEAPPPPTLWCPDLDPGWEAIILRCLAREPAERFESAGQVAVALENPLPPPPTTPRGMKPSRGRRRWKVAVALVGAALAGILGWLLFGRGWSSDRAAPPPVVVAPRTPAPRARPSLAVVGFKNLTEAKEVAWMSTAVAELLRGELAEANALRPIPGESVARMQLELGIADTEALDPERLEQVRKNLGADWVIIGSFFSTGRAEDSLTVTAWLQDTKSERPIETLTERGKGGELPEVVARLAGQIRATLGLPPRAATAGGGSQPLPTGAAAQQLYAEGIERLRLFDFPTAKERLLRAVEADPLSPSARAALAEVWSELGFDANAVAEARKAFELASALPREEKLSIEERLATMEGSWNRAIEVGTTLWTLAPDNIDYGLRLAEAQSAAGKGRDALATVARLRALPGPAGGDPRIELAAAEAARSLGDARAAASAAGKAIAEAEGRGAKLLAARGLLLRAWAERRLDDKDAALETAERARSIFAAAGDRGGEATAAKEIGVVRWQKGDHAIALEIFREAEGAYRKTGNRRGLAATLNNEAIVLRELGRLAEAGKAYEQALALHEETASRVAMAATLNNLGDVRLAEGATGEARKRFESALELARAIPNDSAAALSLTNLGRLEIQEGNLVGAEAHVEEARRIHEAAGDSSNVANDLSRIGDIALLRGELPRARSSFDQALALRERGGEKMKIQWSKIALARVLLEEGKGGEAETLLRAAAEWFRQEGQPGGETTARCHLGGALLAQGKGAEAGVAAEKAAELAKSAGEPSDRFEAALLRGRIDAASGRAGAAVTTLESTLAALEKAGSVPLLFEARLALAEAELAAGRGPSARARLTALRKDAAARGFGLIERKAAARR
jgi:serine/threonine protein kinase/tetratricopeptide (TPR) repeat protein